MPLNAPSPEDPSLSDSRSIDPALRSVELVPGGPVSGAIRPPGSKSITNRALLCAAFAQGNSTLSGTLRSEDTAVMIEALRLLGVEIESGRDGGTLRVSGRGARGSSRKLLERSAEPLSLYVGNSGTTIRFLTAALSAAGGHYRLYGIPRMHERPIGDLVDAIAPVLQGSIVAESAGGCPPVHLDGEGWNGNPIDVAGNVSSQYLSGLLMAAPLSGHRVRLQVTGELVSKPYVEMTARVMQSFGAVVKQQANRQESGDRRRETMFDVSDRDYVGCDFAIEPDASAASYFWAAAAISGGTVTVQGLGPDAVQGDVAFCDVLRQMGCTVSASTVANQTPSLTVIGKPLHGLDIDMNAISDTVQTLAVVALFAEGPTRVRGVAHNRFKEADRIADLARELRKLGARVQEHEDGLTIVPPAQSPESGAVLETYGDHRMAMSLALAGLRLSGIRILDPACTAKTYPDFFADLESLTGRPHRWAERPKAGGERR